MIYSKQRELVLQAVQRSQGQHPTADMLCSVIRQQSPNVSLATVYRNLNQLVDAGQIARVSIPGAADRYDPVTDGHPHMLCSCCGGVFDIPVSLLPELAGPVETATGCHIESYRIIFYGRCPACRS